jgi:hypothetical protein
MDIQENGRKNGTDQSRDITKATKYKKKIKRKLLLPILIIALIAAIGILFLARLLDRQDNKEEILTVSTLEKIINISELSTFQAVYNGIAEVMNEKKSDQIDYYVSYEAKVYAGINFEEVKITMDEEAKKISVVIPEIGITDVNVDIASLDYIFHNKKANTSTVSEQAYKACIADVTNESEKEAAIYDLAEQNAKNIIKALISPFIEQLDSDYELEIN